MLFEDPNPNAINFYRIEVIDEYDQSIYSVTALGQIADFDPPQPPSGMTGFVDTLGTVRLSWSKNPEQDVAGYHVYFANSLNEDFAILTSDSLRQDTAYIDTIVINTLTEEVYYKFKAIDFMGNRSEFSEPLKLLRPDLIPPVSGVFKSDSVSAEKVWIRYVNSTSKDVLSNELQRKKLEDMEWTSIANNTNDGLQVIEELELEDKTTYLYRILTTDDAGWVTISDTMSIRTLF